MSQAQFDVTAPKRPVNVRMNSDLVAQAKSLKINLSRELEAHLAELVAKRQRQAWKEENKEAIDQYNTRIFEVDVFGKQLRQF
ncbi:MAG: type II toxin-antitoxin system CcdA family antitoxin [Magnetococcales bacterium]|nr:type II toxin-antitoxin system CcdA family antitoxin [Magnetococcales bacterium]